MIVLLSGKYIKERGDPSLVAPTWEGKMATQFSSIVGGENSTT
jgi:hypothetical protein